MNTVVLWANNGRPPNKNSNRIAFFIFRFPFAFASASASAPRPVQRLAARALYGAASVDANHLMGATPLSDAFQGWGVRRKLARRPSPKLWVSRKVGHGAQSKLSV